MKKYTILITTLLLITTLIITALPVLASLVNVRQSHTAGIAAHYLHSTQQLSQSFTTDQAYSLYSVKYKAYRIGTPTAFYVEIKLADANHKPTGSVLASSGELYPNLTTDSAGAVYTWILDTPYALSATDEYCIIFRCTGDTSNKLVFFSDSTNAYAGGIECYSSNGTTWTSYVTWDLYFQTYSIDTVEPDIYTLPPLYDQPTTVYLRGLITALGEYDRVHAYFEYGYTSEDYGNVFDCGYITKTGIDGLYQQELKGIETATTYHYRAYCTAGGETYYGEDETFNLSDDVLHVITMYPHEITYSTAKGYIFLDILGVEDTVDLSLNHGTTIEVAGNTVIQADADTPGIYEYEITSLDEASKYYIQAKAVGVSSTAYGQILSFYTLNPNQPDAIQKLGTWFSRLGFTGEGIWWLFGLIITALAWLFLHNKGKIGQVSAGIITLLVVGLLISISVIDVWLVILLSLGAGITIFGLIFKNRQAT